MAARSAPFFLGRGYSATEQDGFLAIRPVGGQIITEPPDTFALILPVEGLLSVTAEPLREPGGARLRFHGCLDRAGLPDEVALSPLHEEDAEGLRRALTERLGLPRVPKAVHGYDLGTPRIEPGAYITMVGRQSGPTHCELADFEGCKLTGPLSERHLRAAGKRYHVTGFYHPGSTDPLVVGYRGPTVRLTSLRPEPDGAPRAEEDRYWPPPSPFQRGPVTAWLGVEGCHQRHDQLEFSARLDERTLLVAALDGHGSQRMGNSAARVAQLVLSGTLAEASYQPLLGPPVEPVAYVYSDFAAWTAWLLPHEPLPREPGPLLLALSRRIGAVLEAMNLRGLSLSAAGVLAVIRDGEATLLRRGHGAAYLRQAGALRPVLRPDILGRDPGYAAALELQPELAAHRWIMLSCFQTAEPPTATPPLTVELRRGERLILVAGAELLEELERDPAREALLATDPGRALADPTEAMEEGGFAVVAVDG